MLDVDARLDDEQGFGRWRWLLSRRQHSQPQLVTAVGLLNAPNDLHEKGVARLLGWRRLLSDDRRPIGFKPFIVTFDAKFMNGGSDFASVDLNNERKSGSLVRADPLLLDLKVGTHMTNTGQTETEPRGTPSRVRG